jgi:hypothetical protein
MHILRNGAVFMLFASLLLAWIATFSNLIVIDRVRAIVRDHGSLVRSHIDLLLMSILCFSLSNVNAPLPRLACWLIVIGGFTNPSLFLIRAVVPDELAMAARRTYRLCSFLTTTTGFVWAGWVILAAGVTN